MSEEKKSDTYELREAKQEKIFLEKINRSLEGKIDELKKGKEALEKKIQEQRKNMNEVEQERALLNTINTRLASKLDDSVSAKSTTSEKYLKINLLLDTFKKISLTRMVEISELEESEVLSHLTKMQADKQVVSLGEDKEMICHNCSSSQIGIHFHCPACTGSNYKQGKLIEHYKCENVSLAESYTDNRCPKCNQRIKAIGVDYAVLENYYSCIECGNKFPDPFLSFRCERCNHRFNYENAKWKSSQFFKRSNISLS
jgi:DNA-directed RNA polymerase subunit RPC12/RpoP